MTRKFKALCLIVILCISLLPAIATAEETNAFKIAADKSSLQTEDTLILTVKGEHLENLFAAEVNITFDSSLLEYKGVIYGSPNSVRVLQENTIELAKTGMSLSGNADLFRLEFKAKLAGKATLKLANVELQSREDARNLTSTKKLIDTGLDVEVFAKNSSPPSPTAPSPTPTPTATPRPTDIVVQIQAVTDTNGLVIASIDRATMQKAIQSATEKAIVIEVQSSVEPQRIVVQIPVESLKLAKDSLIKTVLIDTGFATVAINLNVLNQTNLNGSGNLELSIAKTEASALTLKLRDHLEIGQFAYDFNLSVDGVKITSFAGNGITVGIPYVLKTNENPNAVVVYYVTDNGSLEVVKNGKYNSLTGKLEFKPKHFSKYLSANVNVSFNDIAAVDWAQNAIEGLTAREAVNGVGNGSFNPDGSVTRSEFVAMLTRLFDLADKQADTSFTDVVPGAWYYDAIAAAQKLGIVNGKADGNFGINEKISRQDMAVMIYRASQLRQISLPANSAPSFNDQAVIADYARNAVTAVQSAGIVNGVRGGNFAPYDLLTRAQAATVLYRLYQLVE